MFFIKKINVAAIIRALPYLGLVVIAICCFLIPAFLKVSPFVYSFLTTIGGVISTLLIGVATCKLYRKICFFAAPKDEQREYDELLEKYKEENNAIEKLTEEVLEERRRFQELTGQNRKVETSAEKNQKFSSLDSNENEKVTDSADKQPKLSASNTPSPTVNKPLFEIPVDKESKRLATLSEIGAIDKGMEEKLTVLDESVAQLKEDQESTIAKLNVELRMAATH